MSFTERHIIETPEQLQLKFDLAGVGSRFLAIAIDTLIQLAVGGIAAFILILFGLTGLVNGWRLTSLWATAGLIAFLFLLYFGYFVLFEILWGGQTPGKRAIGIRVIKDSGRPLSPAEVFGRNLLRVIDQIPGFYAVAVLTAMFNAQGKRLGDFVAGSVVVREKSLNLSQPHWTQPSPSRPQTLLGASQLTADEVELIDTFLARRYDLTSDVRHRMAHEIVRRLESKIVPGADHHARAEETLEALAHEYRSLGGY